MRDNDRGRRGQTGQDREEQEERINVAFDRWLARQLNQVYGGVLSEPIPQAMLDLLAAAERNAEAGEEQSGMPDGMAVRTIEQRQQMQGQQLTGEQSEQDEASAGEDDIWGEEGARREP